MDALRLKYCPHGIIALDVPFVGWILKFVGANILPDTSDDLGSGKLFFHQCEFDLIMRKHT
jgi:hypothetical protein